ncbi:hypothetical protein [Methanobrevibacter thaueri]|uniref:hypothetical protein n=1 Tax=Methanobrevibacter thaueri TaxID=190975 RepID=UPI0014035F2E|nr:hypothetical protein [Methanobrevibacter thaueri]
MMLYDKKYPDQDAGGMKFLNENLMCLQMLVAMHKALLVLSMFENVSQFFSWQSPLLK